MKKNNINTFSHISLKAIFILIAILLIFSCGKNQLNLKSDFKNEISGCMDESSSNYNPDATISAGCSYSTIINDGEIEFQLIIGQQSEVASVELGAGTQILNIYEDPIPSQIELSVSEYLQSLPPSDNITSLSKSVALTPFYISLSQTVTINIPFTLQPTPSSQSSSSQSLSSTHTLSTDNQPKIKIIKLDNANDTTWKIINNSSCANNLCTATISSFGLFTVASIDNCPTNPLKTEPGVCGCEILDEDTDEDNILDCNDNCPTVKNPNQDESLCTSIPTDNCPTDPLKTEPGVCGCNNQEDSDNDGVIDCLACSTIGAINFGNESSCIFQNLFITWPLNNDDGILNGHMYFNTIDTPIFQNFMTPGTEQYLSSHNISVVDIEPYGNAWFNDIAHIPFFPFLNLTTIKINNIKIKWNDLHPDIFKHLTHLTTIEIKNTNLTDNNIQKLLVALQHLPQLTTLDISQNTGISSLPDNILNLFPNLTLITKDTNTNQCTLNGLLSTKDACGICNGSNNQLTWYQDADEDGLGDPLVSIQACLDSSGTTGNQYPSGWSPLMQSYLPSSLSYDTIKRSGVQYVLDKTDACPNQSIDSNYLNLGICSNFTPDFAHIRIPSNGTANSNFNGTLCTYITSPSGTSCSDMAFNEYLPVIINKIGYNLVYPSDYPNQSLQGQTVTWGTGLIEGQWTQRNFFSSIEEFCVDGPNKKYIRKEKFEEIIGIDSSKSLEIWNALSSYTIINESGKIQMEISESIMNLPLSYAGVTDKISEIISLLNNIPTCKYTSTTPEQDFTVDNGYYNLSSSWINNSLSLSNGLHIDGNLSSFKRYRPLFTTNFMDEMTENNRNNVLKIDMTSYANSSTEITKIPPLPFPNATSLIIPDYQYNNSNILENMPRGALRHLTKLSTLTFYNNIGSNIDKLITELNFLKNQTSTGELPLSSIDIRSCGISESKVNEIKALLKSGTSFCHDYSSSCEQIP